MAVCTCLPDRRQVLRRVSAVGYAAVSWPLGRVGQPLFACVRETWKAVCVYGCLRTAACVLQLSTCDLRLAACGLCLAAFDLRPATCGLRLAAFDLRPATCGLQTATCDCDLRLRLEVCGLRPARLAVWYEKLRNRAVPEFCPVGFQPSPRSGAWLIPP